MELRGEGGLQVQIRTVMTRANKDGGPKTEPWGAVLLARYRRGCKMLRRFRKLWRSDNSWVLFGEVQMQSDWLHSPHFCFNNCAFWVACNAAFPGYRHAGSASAYNYHLISVSHLFLLCMFVLGHSAIGDDAFMFYFSLSDHEHLKTFLFHLYVSQIQLYWCLMFVKWLAYNSQCCEHNRYRVLLWMYDIILLCKNMLWNLEINRYAYF